MFVAGRRAPQPPKRSWRGSNGCSGSTRISRSSTTWRPRIPISRRPAAGAGRMIRSPTVFEEVVKTVCTTNCTWSATERMVAALVEHLGEPAPGAESGPLGRGFPTPEAMASAGERFYKDVVRAGYRGPYFIELARLVRDGEVDLEILGHVADEIPDDEVEARLLALPGVGPYAAADVMMMIGR